MPALIEGLAAAYALPADPRGAPARAVARGDGVWVRALAAIHPGGGTMGAKVFASARVRGVGYLVTLFDQQSGALLALLDARDITAMRTAAATAVALRALAPAEPITLAVLGSGMEARAHLEAIAAVCRIASLHVFSPTPTNRDAFAVFAAQAQGIADARAAATPEAAVAGADVILCAARARGEVPVLGGAWLRPGATVLSIGSTLPEQREVDVETIARAGLIVADMPDEVKHATGDMIAARAAGIDIAGRTCGLEALIRGERRREAGTIALYKSVGSGLQDIVAADIAYREAVRRGLATPLPLELAMKRTPR
jgi:ornithine cyclodeaminase/alanine dehydrogenase